MVKRIAQTNTLKAVLFLMKSTVYLNWWTLQKISDRCFNHEPACHEEVRLGRKEKNITHIMKAL